jgi:hypothetical protein
MIHCTLLYYAVLYNTRICCTILCYTILYDAILIESTSLRYTTTLHYNILYYTMLYYTMLYHTTPYYTILHHAKAKTQVSAAATEPSCWSEPSLALRTRGCDLQLPHGYEHFPFLKGAMMYTGLTPSFLACCTSALALMRHRTNRSWALQAPMYTGLAPSFLACCTSALASMRHRTNHGVVVRTCSWPL